MSFAAILGAIVGKLLGLPYQGSHSATGGAPDNWQSRNAIDIGVPVGTPVYAPVSGTLGPTGYLPGEGPGGTGRFAGQRVNLYSGPGGTADQGFYFAHLSRLAAGITQGATVRQGQLLGYTGSANGSPHLHFAVEKGDPRSYYKASGSPPSPPQAAASSQTASDTPDATELASGCATIVAVGFLAWATIGAGVGFLLERLT